MLMKIKAALLMLANALLSFLPSSPFTKFFDSMEALPVLGFLNDFIPVSEMIAMGEAWTACVAVFYLYQAALRFTKLIQ